MAKRSVKESKRFFRHKRIRTKVRGFALQPRLCLHRSLNNLFAQVVDDSSGKILFGMSTLTKQLRDKVKDGGNVKAASFLGEAFALEAQKRGIKKVCFDRGGYMYHGRVQAFAEAARKAGMEF